MRTSSDERPRATLATTPPTKALVFSLASFVVVFLAACTWAAAGPGPSAGQAGLKVRILLYSGRPDPTFVISDGAKIGQLKQLLDQATPDTAAPDRRKSVLPSILGYKGILVENPGGLGGLPRSLAVYQQNVEARDGATRFLTNGGAIESFLIDEAIQSKALDDKAIELLRARGNSKPE